MSMDFKRKIDILDEEIKNLRKYMETLKRFQVETLEQKNTIYKIKNISIT